MALRLPPNMAVVRTRREPPAFSKWCAAARRTPPRYFAGWRYHTLRPVILGAILTGVSTGLAAGEPEQLKKNVSELNARSMQLLDLTLNELMTLIDSSPYIERSLSDLEESGEIRFIRRLEEKGYVRVTVGVPLPLPDGREATFLNVTPIGRGAAIREAIIELR